MKSAFKLLDNKITFLVLDYNRPDILEKCLISIREKTSIKHEIITLINSGVTSHAYEMFNKKLTDKLILSYENEGSSLGILRLVQNCTTDYFIFLQSDNILNININQQTIEKIDFLFKNNVGVIDLTGLVGHFCEFSERAFIMQRDFYLQHDLITGYGTGPYYNPNFDNSEQSTLKWIKQNNKVIIPSGKPSVIDSGKYCILQLSCGGVLKRRADTHQVWVLNKPKQKTDCYGLNDEEWDLILNEKWINGTVPKNCEKSAFLFYSSEPDPIEI